VCVCANAHCRSTTQDKFVLKQNSSHLVAGQFRLFVEHTCKHYLLCCLLEIVLLLYDINKVQRCIALLAFHIYRTCAKRFANHNTLTNQSTFCISERGASVKQDRVFETDRQERCCNNVQYVKNNVFFKESSIKSYSSSIP